MKIQSYESQVRFLPAVAATVERQRMVSRDTAAYVLFAGTLIIYLSRILWYDLRTIYAQVDQDFSLSPFFTFWVAGMAPAFLTIPFYVARRELYSFLVLIYFLLIQHGLVTGILYGNDPLLVAQETVKYLFVPTAFLLTVRLADDVSPWKILKFLTTTTAVYVFLRAFLYVALTGGDVQLLWGTANETLVYCALQAILLFESAPFAALLAQPLIPATTLISLYGQKRTLALCFALTMGLSAAILIVRRASVRRWLPVAAVVIVATCSLAACVYSGHFKKLATGDPTFSQTDQNRRVVEINLVRKEFSDHPDRIFFGFGGGATLYLPSWLKTKSEPRIHSLHNTIAVMTYRHGLLGDFVFVSTLLYGLGWCLRALQNGNRVEKMAANLIITYKIVAFVASFTMYGVVDDMVLGVLAGITYRAGRRDDVA